MKKRFLELFEILSEKILVLDGAMGTEIAKLNLNLKCNEEINLKYPEILKKIHLSYLNAGADIIETNTFNANLISLKEYGLEKKCFEINKKAVEIARKAVKKFKEKKFIAGSIGPTNKILCLSKDISFDEMENSYFIQILGLIEGGVDFILIETITDSLNVKSAIFGMKRAFKKAGKEVPFVLSISLSKEGKILNGQSLDAFFYTFKDFNPLGFGINCSLGPEDLKEPLYTLSKITGKPIFFYPNAGLPDEEGNYNFSPEKFAKILKNYAKKGLANVFGGCCGTNPYFIKKIKEEIDGIKPKKRKIREKICLSGLETFEIKKEVKPVFAGERCNIKGSKEFKEAVYKEDFEKAVQIAKEQIEQGAEIIDIFLQDPERGEVEDFKKFLDLLFPSFKKTVMLDCQNLKVLEESLKKIPGKAIINSVNLENKKIFEEISRIAKNWGAFLVFQTIEDKIQINSKEKIKISKKGFEILTKKIGLNGKNIIFDPVILPAQVLDFKFNHIFETLKTIKLLKKEFPENLTILGISNISFGLPSGREVLNSVFLYYAYKYGLDIAILNPEKIKRFFTIEKKERELAEKVLFNLNKGNLEKFINYFKKEIKEKKEIKIFIEPEEIIRNCILKGEKKGLKENLVKLIEKGKKAEEIINEILIPSMEYLGEKFSKGEVILPEVLESASLMKYCLDFLNPYLEKSFKGKARVFVATVKGDVHDIGKNLFSVLAKNNGYEVIDLGVKVSKEEILKKIKEFKPDVLGLSGLLTSSCLEMAEVAEYLSKSNTIPILLLGGAALTKNFVKNKIEPKYKGKVFYAKTAMEGVKILNGLFAKKNI